MISVEEVLATRTSVSLDEFAQLEGITLRSAYRRLAAGTLGVTPLERAGVRSEIRIPVSEIRRRNLGA